jgi:hypothetical protein
VAAELDLAEIERLADQIYRSSAGLERWGWEYIDPGPPRPGPGLRSEPHWAEPPRPDTHDLDARSAYLRSKALKRGVKVGVVLLLAFLLRADRPHVSPFLVVLAIVLAAVWFGPLLLTMNKAATWRTNHQLDRDRARADYSRSHGEWQRNVAEWDASERDRIAEANLWFPLRMRSEPNRVDIFGGTAEGWAALLTVIGASVLRAGTPMLVVDLSENDVAAPLSVLARSQGLPVRRQELPSQLDQAQLLRDLDSEDIAELVGEALNTLRTAGDDVSLRMLDGDLLKGVADRLDAPVTFGRLVEGLRVLQGSFDISSGGGSLSGQELQRLTGYVDAVGEGDRAQGEVQFLRSALELLLGSPMAGRPGNAAELWTPGGLTLLVTSDHNLRRRDLVDRMIAQALLYHLRRRRSGNAGAAGGMLVVAGADHLGHKTLEALARQAKSARVRLVLLIEHLRGELQNLLGGSDSVSVIMRLGNAQEASAAAEFIGRGHSFSLTQLSRQAGDTKTTGTSSTSGVSTSHSGSSGRSGGKAGSGWSDSVSFSESDSTQEGTSESVATSVTDGQTVSRVYEFTVEPTQIQSLAAAAFVLVESASGSRRVVAGSCDPLIVTLDRVAPSESEEAQHRVPHGSSAAVMSSGRQSARALEPDEAISTFILDPPGQLHYMAQRLGQAGYVVRRKDVPGEPWICGWQVTSADGSPIRPDEVMRYK